MTLPKEVDIFGTPYRVVECDKVVNENAEIMWGEIRYSLCEIAIAARPPCPPPIKTLLHELIHGVCDELEIELDEKNTKRLTARLTDTLIRNNLVKE